VIFLVLERYFRPGIAFTQGLVHARNSRESVAIGHYARDSQAVDFEIFDDVSLFKFSSWNMRCSNGSSLVRWHVLFLLVAQAKARKGLVARFPPDYPLTFAYRDRDFSTNKPPDEILAMPSQRGRPVPPARLFADGAFWYNFFAGTGEYFYHAMCEHRIGSDT